MHSKVLHVSDNDGEDDYDSVLQAPTQDAFWQIFDGKGEPKTTCDNQ